MVKIISGKNFKAHLGSLDLDVEDVCYLTYLPKSLSRRSFFGILIYIHHTGSRYGKEHENKCFSQKLLSLAHSMVRWKMQKVNLQKKICCAHLSWKFSGKKIVYLSREVIARSTWQKFFLDVSTILFGNNLIRTDPWLISWIITGI